MLVDYEFRQNKEFRNVFVMMKKNGNLFGEDLNQKDNLF
jgi:hypothetical protein